MCIKYIKSSRFISEIQETQSWNIAGIEVEVEV